MELKVIQQKAGVITRVGVVTLGILDGVTKKVYSFVMDETLKSKGICVGDKVTLALIKGKRALNHWHIVQVGVKDVLL